MRTPLFPRRRTSDSARPLFRLSVFARSGVRVPRPVLPTAPSPDGPTVCTMLEAAGLHVGRVSCSPRVENQRACVRAEKGFYGSGLGGESLGTPTSTVGSGRTLATQLDKWGGGGSVVHSPIPRQRSCRRPDLRTFYVPACPTTGTMTRTGGAGHTEPWGAPPVTT